MGNPIYPVPLQGVHGEPSLYVDPLEGHSELIQQLIDENKQIFLVAHHVQGCRQPPVLQVDHNSDDRDVSDYLYYRLWCILQTTNLDIVEKKTRLEWGLRQIKAFLDNGSRPPEARRITFQNGNGKALAVLAAAFAALWIFSRKSGT